MPNKHVWTLGNPNKNFQQKIRRFLLERRDLSSGPGVNTLSNRLGTRRYTRGPENCDQGSEDRTTAFCHGSGPPPYPDQTRVQPETQIMSNFGQILDQKWSNFVSIFCHFFSKIFRFFFENFRKIFRFFLQNFEQKIEKWATRFT